MPTLEFKGKSFVYAHHLSVPFRELLIDAKKSWPTKGHKPSLDDNLIIHGDNLHALKALLPVYAGKVDCIYIDPPYNTGNEGWCYNDNVRSPLMREWLKKSANPVEKEDLERHDKWLSMMWPRLKLLYELLAEEGVIFVSIDDNEVHRLRSIMDEIFDEDNFIANIVWHKMDSPKNTAIHFSEDHDHILVYAKHAANWFPNLLERSEAMLARYKNPDKDPRGPWLLSDLAARNQYSAGHYEIKTPSGKVISGPPAGSYWRVSKTKFEELDRDKRIWWGTGDVRPGIKRFLSEVREGIVPQTIWSWKEVGSTRNAKQELSHVLGKQPGDDIFITPKPTSLVQRILTLGTKKNSIILDSFAGSGTTAHAVLALNKKDGGNRKFILVETEDYADTLTAERVRRVIEGYTFEGTQGEELLRVPLNWAKFQKADALVEKAESIEKFEGSRFDNVTKVVEDGALVITGEKKVTEKTEGLGGSFTFAALGPEMTLDKLLAGGLPMFEALAKYVFFTATGRTLTDIPKQTAKTLGHIGETDVYRVHLHYKPDKSWLQSNDAALTEKLVDAMVTANTSRKKLLVFAAAKFMSQRELARQGVDFCQLPYAIHRILGD
ncbi:MAG: site-specific DNA-methyltransferase [Limisphaerales bacterium]